VVQDYGNRTCRSGYDLCSYERNRLNSYEGTTRYFCAEDYRNHWLDDVINDDYYDDYYNDDDYDDYYNDDDWY
jgi:hypothetical protein